MNLTLEFVTDSRTAETRGCDSRPAPCSPSRTHLDLFSGIGGFALAARWAGLQTIGFSEIDPYATRVLKRHWPDVPNYGDIRNVRGVRAWIITGGFPCQPYSLAGNREGDSDDRALWPEMFRVVKASRPAWVIGENVPGIVSVALDGVLSDLEGIGYSVQAFVVPAVAVDARHRRDRVWIVANSNSIDWWKQQQQCECPREWARNKSDRCGETIPNTNRSGLGQQRRPEPKTVEHSAAECGGRWPAEPAVRRMANGIPNRVDRIRGLGNAIVPGIAYRLMRMAIESEDAWMENAKLTDGAGTNV